VVDLGGLAEATLMSLPPNPPSPLPPRSGCLTAIMVVIGIILLLPGLCSLIFVFGGLIKSVDDVQFVAVCLMVGAAGVALIWWAVRRRGP
jgi:hypothetical protein